MTEISDYIYLIHNTLYIGILQVLKYNNNNCYHCCVSIFYTFNSTAIPCISIYNLKVIIKIFIIINKHNYNGSVRAIGCWSSRFRLFLFVIIFDCFVATIVLTCYNYNIIVIIIIIASCVKCNYYLLML